MSVIYPRTCSIKRSIPPADASTSSGVGFIGYSGMQRETSGGRGEMTIASNVACSIQATSTGRATRTNGLPSDAPGPVHWRILIPKRLVARGAVRDRDVVIDDENIRYHVEAAYWNSLGYQLKAVRLEA
jgi:hypothetical protein